MDLIYTDKNRKDIDVLSDYELDEAFGKNENNFSLKISLSEHCMEPGCVILLKTQNMAVSSTL